MAPVITDAIELTHYTSIFQLDASYVCSSRWIIATGCFKLEVPPAWYPPRKGTRQILEVGLGLAAG